MLIVTLVSATLWAIVRKPGVGFLAAFFLVVLAPTSSFVPVGSQTIAEHRMYLPLAAVLTLLVLGGYAAGRFAVRRGWLSAGNVAGVGHVLGNRRRRVMGYIDVPTKPGLPERPRHLAGHGGEGSQQRSGPQQLSANVLAAAGRSTRPSPITRRPWKSSPTSRRPTTTSANVLAGRGQVDEAIAHYRKALEIKPDYAEAHNNLGIALAGRGQVDEAIAHYQKALEIKPDYAEAHNNLGNVLAGRGQVDEAIVHYQKALEIKPDYTEAHVQPR